MALRIENARSVYSSKFDNKKYVDKANLMGHDFVCIWNEENVPIAKYLLNDENINRYFSSLNANIEYSYNDLKNIKIGNKKVTLPKDIYESCDNVIKKILSSPGYIGDDGEHVIDLKSYKIGTHFDVNLLIGNRIGYPDPMLTTPKGSLNSYGQGSFRAGEAKQVTATRYNLHIEENGEPCSRQIYITEDGKLIFSSIDIENCEKAICKHYQNYSIITYIVNNLEISRTFYILPYEDNGLDAVECQIVNIKNLSSKKRNIKVVFTGMFGLASPESQMNDIIYASVTWQGGIIKDENGNNVSLYPMPHPGYLKVHKRFATCFCDGKCFDEFSTSYEDFVGSGDLSKPGSILNLGNSLSMKVSPFFAIGKNITLCENDNKNVISYVGYKEVRTKDDNVFLSSLSKFIEKYKDDNNCFDSFEKVKSFTKSYSSFFQVKTNDNEFDKYVNNNLPFQVYYQSYVSRSFAWTQKAFREIGFREIQDMYASMNYIIGMGQKDLAKSMLCEWVKNVYKFGYANHNFYRTGKQGGECSDDALWLILAIYRYVSLSKDTNFLYEKYPVYDTKEDRSILDTILAIIKYSNEISIGKHNLPLLDRCDWNDCLKIDDNWIDGKTKEEKYAIQNKTSKSIKFKSDYSESVMNAFLLKIGIDETSILSKMIGKDDLSKSLALKSKKLSSHIQKYAWKDDFFARVLINGHKGFSYLGAHDDGLSGDDKINGSYFLNSFSWSILSNVASEEQIKTMVESTKKYLCTDSGIKLCSPIALSRVSTGAASDSYFPGDRENGGIFKHAEMMAACAFIKASKNVKDENLSLELCKLAKLCLDSALPYKTLEHPYKIKGNPRFCTQYNNSITGEHIGPMLSGTSSWLTLVIFELFGYEISPYGISFSPTIIDGFEEYSYSLNFNGTKINVIVKKKSNDEKVGAYHNGEIFDGEFSLDYDNKVHNITFIY